MHFHPLISSFLVPPFNIVLTCHVTDKYIIGNVSMHKTDRENGCLISI